MNWKDFFSFSRRERLGIFFLLVLVAGIFIGKWMFSPPKPLPLNTQEPPPPSAVQTASLSQPPDQPPYTPFHPSKEQTPRRTSFSTPKDRRTYYRQEKEPDERPQSTPRYPASNKFTKDTVIELNCADTLLLMRIPGIGRAYAKRITGYRKLLGGYHRIEQLMEVYDMYEELYVKITPFLTVDPTLVTQIPVNASSLDKLRLHPYINFYQAKAIIETRKKKGPLTSVEDLQLLEEFGPDDWIRITPYLDFQNGKSEKSPVGGGGGGGGSGEGASGTGAAEGDEPAASTLQALRSVYQRPLNSRLSTSKSTVSACPGCH
jgi:DNA uptake protein ComE-like DNA-binding protein